jgi:hypothetical protein
MALWLRALVAGASRLVHRGCREKDCRGSNFGMVAGWLGVTAMFGTWRSGWQCCIYEIVAFVYNW